jgi:hypothetical protein
VITHQHFCAPGFTADDSLEDAVVIVVTTTNIAFLERHDVSR